MNDENEYTIRFEIDGVWTVGDFKEFFDFLDFCFFISFFEKEVNLTEYERDNFLTSLDRAIEFTSPYNYSFRHSFIKASILSQLSFDRGLEASPIVIPSLQIRKIQFSSPGSIDIFGVGQAVDSLFNFLMRVFELVLFSARRHESLVQQKLKTDRIQIENDLKSAELMKLRIENAELLSEVLSKNPEVFSTIVDSQ